MTFFSSRFTVFRAASEHEQFEVPCNLLILISCRVVFQIIVYWFNFSCKKFSMFCTDHKTSFPRNFFLLKGRLIFLFMEMRITRTKPFKALSTVNRFSLKAHSPDYLCEKCTALKQQPSHFGVYRCKLWLLKPNDAISRLEKSWYAPP